jgi:hypothetical protein
LCFPSSIFLHVPIALQICIELFGFISPEKKGWCGWLATTMLTNYFWVHTGLGCKTQTWVHI